MKTGIAAAAMAAYAAAFASVGYAQQPDGNGGTTRYLIQYKSGDGQALREAIEINGGTVVFDYSSLFNGLAADLPPAGYQAVRTSGKAKYIEADYVRTIPVPEPNEEGLLALSGHTAVPAGFPADASAEFVGWGVDRVAADTVWSIAPNFGAANNGVAASDVAEGSLTGDGVVVGLLDSGIDYTHPDLAANIINDCGSGVIRDFIAFDDCSFDEFGSAHGTQVASAIASADNGIGVVGVAPEAKIRPYRICAIFGCPGSAIIAGVVQATKDGVDVMNIGAAGPSSNPFEAAAIAAANQAGVVIVVPAGNEASQEVHFPAGYDTVIAVGATDIHDAPADFTNVGGWLDVTAPGVSIPLATCQGCGPQVVSAAEIAPVPREFIVAAMKGTGVADLNGVTAIDAGRACASSLGDPIPPAMAGKVAVIIRGDCSFAEKTQSVESAGAIGTIIYDNGPGFFLGTLGAYSANGPTVSMLGPDGATLAADIAANGGAAIVDLEVQPGGYDYVFANGTSFSSPHVAGVAALMLEANPELSPADVRRIIEQTAENLGSNVLFGNGMVRADNAVSAAN